MADTQLLALSDPYPFDRSPSRIQDRDNVLNRVSLLLDDYVQKITFEICHYPTCSWLTPTKYVFCLSQMQGVCKFCLSQFTNKPESNTLFLSRTSQFKDNSHRSQIQTQAVFLVSQVRKLLFTHAYKHYNRKLQEMLLALYPTPPLPFPITRIGSVIILEFGFTLNSMFSINNMIVPHFYIQDKCNLYKFQAYESRGTNVINLYKSQA